MTQKFNPGVLFNPEWAENGTPMGVHQASTSTRTAEAANMSFVTTPTHPFGNARVVEIDLASNDESYIAVRNTTDGNNISATRLGTYAQFCFRQNGNSLRNATARVWKDSRLSIWISTSGVLEIRRDDTGAVLGTGTTALADDTWYLIEAFFESATQVVLRVASLSGYSAGNPLTMTTEVNVTTTYTTGVPQGPILLGETTNRTAGGSTPYFYFANLALGYASGDDLPGIIRFINMDMDGNGAVTEANASTAHSYTEWDEQPPDGTTTYMGFADTTELTEVSTLEAVASGAPASPQPGGSDYVHGCTVIVVKDLNPTGKGRTGTLEATIHDGTNQRDSSNPESWTTGSFHYTAWCFPHPPPSIPEDWTATHLGTLQIGATGWTSDGTTGLRMTAVKAMIAWSDADETIADIPAVPSTAGKTQAWVM